MTLLERLKKDKKNNKGPMLHDFMEDQAETTLKIFPTPEIPSPEDIEDLINDPIITPIRGPRSVYKIRVDMLLAIHVMITGKTIRKRYNEIISDVIQHLEDLKISEDEN